MSHPLEKIKQIFEQKYERFSVTLPIDKLAVGGVGNMRMQMVYRSAIVTSTRMGRSFWSFLSASA